MNTLSRSFVLAFVVVLATFSALPVRADFVSCAKSMRGDQQYSDLGAIVINECLKLSAHRAGLRLYIEGIANADQDNLNIRIAEGVQELLNLVVNLPDASSEVTRSARVVIENALRCDLHLMDGTGSAEPASCPSIVANATTLTKQKWDPVILPSSVYKLGFIDPLQSMSEVCAVKNRGAGVAACDEAFEHLLPYLEVLSLMRNQLLPAANSEAVEAISATYSDLHERWKNYLADTGHQYFWELSWNKRRHGGFREIALRRPAPTSRWVVLHPTAGIYHSKSAPDGSDTSGVAVLKVIGFKRWSYDSKTNKPKNLYGLSLISTFADIAGVRDSGIGIAADFRSFSVGYSKHGGNGVVTLNADLGRLLANKPEGVSGWLDILRDKGM